MYYFISYIVHTDISIWRHDADYWSLQGERARTQQDCAAFLHATFEQRVAASKEFRTLARKGSQYVLASFSELSVFLLNEMPFYTPIQFNLSCPVLTPKVTSDKKLLYHSVENVYSDKTVFSRAGNY